MRELDQRVKDLALYRLQRAKEDLNSARNNLNSEDYRTANNRSYYAIFHSLRAILALDEYDSKKHSGIISEFRNKYIRTHVFDSEISDMIGDAFEVRNKSDYDDMYIISKAKTQEQVENAEKIIYAVEKYMQSEEII
ncbi:MAG: HEPN domain-containing protein [Lachnospiraceae bacterium]|nr:HEPN domain-containing protein [Lachnospiraceae bacterium]